MKLRLEIVADYPDDEIPDPNDFDVRIRSREDEYFDLHSAKIVDISREMEDDFGL